MGTLPKSGGGPGTTVGHKANSHDDKVNVEESKGTLGSMDTKVSAILSNQEQWLLLHFFFTSSLLFYKSVFG